MSDILKFRVWYKPNECYIDINDGDMFYLEPNGRLTIGVYDGDADDMRYLREEDIIVERCTGLKDKNGKLIYEGDIISFNEIKECGTVVWDKNNLLWRYCGKNEKHYVQPLGDLDMDYWQVVGNIHENEELLRGAQWQ